MAIKNAITEIDKEIEALKSEITKLEEAKSKLLEISGSKKITKKRGHKPAVKKVVKKAPAKKVTKKSTKKKTAAKKVTKKSSAKKMTKKQCILEGLKAGLTSRAEIEKKYKIVNTGSMLSKMVKDGEIVSTGRGKYAVK